MPNPSLRIDLSAHLLEYMNLAAVHTSIGFAAPPPPGHAPNPAGQTLQLVGTLVIMFVMIYFVMIRPQQRKAREHQALIQGLKPGDKVLIGGGIIGVVVSVKEKTLSIRSADTKLEVLRSAVTEVTERASGPSATSGQS